MVSRKALAEGTDVGHGRTHPRGRQCLGKNMWMKGRMWVMESRLVNGECCKKGKVRHGGGEGAKDEMFIDWLVTNTNRRGMVIIKRGCMWSSSVHTFYSFKQGDRHQIHRPSVCHHRPHRQTPTNVPQPGKKLA